MKVLLDNCVPRGFGDLLVGHEVIHCSRLGWEKLQNGKLISAAEAEGFPVMVTVDSNLAFQQNLTGRRLAIVCLRAPNNTKTMLAPLAETLLARLNQFNPGTVATLIHPDFQ